VITLIAIVAILLIAVAFTLILRALSGNVGSETVTQIGAYGFTGPAAPEVPGSLSEEPHGVRATWDRFTVFVGAKVGRRLSRLGETEMRARLVSAGMYSTSPGRIYGYQVILGVAFPLLWLWLAGLAGIDSLLYIVGAVVLALCGWILPLFYIDFTRRKRLETIEYDLPDLIDLLVVTLEAGLSFTGSLRMAAGRMTGPLAQELRLTLQEQSMGLTLTEALHNLVRRADTPGVRLFARAMTQGEQLGVSTAQIMRTLAEEMRKKRKAAAEERAQKAPIKMLFPLLIFIFPAMFVVILVPALIRIADTLG
jgi:tight adherence protein C